MWIALPGLNPEPWAIGPLSVIRKGGKMIPVVGRNTQLRSYQDALKERVRHWLTATEQRAELLEVDVRITFYFWRRLDTYTGPSGRNVTKHRVDTTNLQKAAEDALHDVFYKNDNVVRFVQSFQMTQTKSTRPMIVIEIHPLTPEEIVEAQESIPVWVMDKIDQHYAGVQAEPDAEGWTPDTSEDFPF